MDTVTNMVCVMREREKGVVGSTERGRSIEYMTESRVKNFFSPKKVNR